MRSDNHYHYNRLWEQEKEAVDEAFECASAVMRDHNIEPAMDDRAERLVDALAAYLLESREINPVSRVDASNTWGNPDSYKGDLK